MCRQQAELALSVPSACALGGRSPDSIDWVSPQNRVEDDTAEQWPLLPRSLQPRRGSRKNRRRIIYFFGRRTSGAGSPRRASAPVGLARERRFRHKGAQESGWPFPTGRLRGWSVPSPPHTTTWSVRAPFFSLFNLTGFFLYANQICACLAADWLLRLAPAPNSTRRILHSQTSSRPCVKIRTEGRSCTLSQLKPPSQMLLRT